MKLHDNELIKVAGGGLSSQFLNALVRVVQVVIEVGKMIGSSLRRTITKTYC